MMFHLSNQIQAMAKKDRRKGNHSNKNQNRQAKKASQPSDNQVQTRTIMRMTTSVPRQDKIKEPFKDKEVNEIKEYIDTYSKGNHKENLPVLEKQLLLFGTYCNLFEERKWKKSGHIGSQAMTSSCTKTCHE